MVREDSLARACHALRSVSLFFLILCFPGMKSWCADESALQIRVHDAARNPIAGATVAIKLNGSILQTVTTDSEGKASAHLHAGQFSLNILKETFQPLEDQKVVMDGVSAAELDVELVPKVVVRETVTVNGSENSTVDQGSSPGETRDREEIKKLPGKPPTLSDALPSTPGVVRGPNGELAIAGAKDEHNALIVNSVDATDPATGEFGLTVPVDSIQVVSVSATPYLTQYGGFTAAVVSAVTRPGGDKWNFELNDPLPEFNVRSYHLRGLRSATPRFNFGGPLIPQKLYFFESAEYSLDKVPVRLLPFPQNETIKDSVNSFSQLDYVFSSKHVLTATVHVAPSYTRYANLDFFNPRSVTPNYRLNGLGTSLIDRYTVGGGVLQSTLAWQDFTAGILPQSNGDMIVTPTGNTGSYFCNQTRHSFRAQWLESYALKPLHFGGVHNFQVGTTVAHSEDNGFSTFRPVLIEDTAGAILRRINFVGGRRFAEKDWELAFYGQDHWKLNSALALDGGIRAEEQAITGTSKIAPRAGFVVTPFGAKRQTVVRGGAGIFYDHVPLNIFAFERYPQMVVTTFFPATGSPGLTQPFFNQLGAGRHLRHFTLKYRDLATGNFAPYSIASNIEVEQPFGQYFSLQAKYLNRDTYGLVTITPSLIRSRNVLLAEGSGISRYKALEFTARVGANTRHPLFVSYIHGASQGNLNGASGYLGNFPFPVVNPSPVTNLPLDVPNRVLVWGETPLPWKLHLTPFVEYRTGFPFSVTNALQTYVGIPNQQRLPGFFSLDTRLSKDFQVTSKYTVRLSPRALNLTNHFNPIAVRSNTGDPQFGSFLGGYGRQLKMDFDVLF